MLSETIAAPMYPRATTGKRRFVVSGVAGLALLFGAAQDSPAQGLASGGCIGYCGNGIAIGIGVVAGAIVTGGIFLAIHHEHHFLKGCIAGGPNGTELQTSDAKLYRLEGDSSLIPAGHRVRLHGSRKKARDGHPVFRVNGLKRDYGPCQASGT